MITSAKWKQLRIHMDTLEIFENDLIEKFILGTGRGGQKLQKTASCVYLQHVPSGIEIKCQQVRSRADNRFYARRRLCEKIEEMMRAEKSQRQREIEKIRQQKRRRSRRTKAKMLAEKRHRAELKATRSKPTRDEEDP